MDSQKNKTILLLYAKNRHEVLSPKGALGGFIRSVAENYHQAGAKVYINQTLYRPDVPLKKNSPGRSKSSLKSLISTITPNYFKRYLKESAIFKENSFIVDAVKSAINEPLDAIVEFYSFGSNAGAQLKSHFKTKLICVYDSPAIDEYTYLNNWKKPIFKQKVELHEKENLTSSDKIVCYSDTVKQYILKRIPSINSKIFIIHVVINTYSLQNVMPRQAFENKFLNIIFVGSHMKWHRVDLLIRAFAQVFYSGNEHLRMTLTGDGETTPSSKALSKELNIDEYVEFKGFVSDQELAHLLCHSHIGVMPGSNWYGAPVKIIDYGLNALSVIAPDTPTIKDSFEDQKNIDLFTQDDLESLTAALRRHAEDLEFRNKLGQQLQSDLNSKYSVEKERQFWNGLAFS